MVVSEVKLVAATNRGERHFMRYSGIFCPEPRANAGNRHLTHSRFILLMTSLGTAPNLADADLPVARAFDHSRHHFAYLSLTAPSPGSFP